MKRISGTKTILISALAALLFVSSCTKEFSSSDKAAEGECFSFNATLPDSGTRTYLDGVQVKWEATDRVAIWYGTLNSGMARADYHVGTIGDDARHATLDGFAKASDDYMAVYPLSAARDCSKKGKLTVELPVKQSLRANSFASGANVSVAYSSTTDLSFKNVGGYLAFKVSSTGDHTIKTIRLTGTAAMSGEVEIKQAGIAAGDPAVDAVIEGVNFLTLDCGDGIVDPHGISSSEGFSENTGKWDEKNDSGEGFSETKGSWNSSAQASGTKSSLPGASTKAPTYSGDDTYYLVSLPGTHAGFALTFVDSEGKTAVARSGYGFTVTRNSNTLIADIAVPGEQFKPDSPVFINEIFCHEDRIELYNPGDEAVDLSGYYFSKDDRQYWAIPSGTTIEAHGYRVFTGGQTDCAMGPTFGISGDKGFDLKLCNGGLVDRIDNLSSITVIGATETYGRRTDGSDEWVVFSVGTIYEDGVCDGDNSKGTVKESPVSSAVALNEVNGNDKYVELHNAGTQSADITGWTLEKDGKTVWTASDASQCTLAAGAYLAIDFVKKSTDPKEAASGISAGKNVKVELKDAGGNSVDVFTRGEEGSGWGDISLPEHEEWSFSRVPDGSGDWKYALPTKGAANGAKTGTIEQYPAADGKVVLNELNGNDKFIELYSTATDEKISLEDCTICKDDGTTPIWTGAPGLVLAPGEHLLLYSEDKKTPETYDARLIFSSGLSPKKTLKIELLSADGGTSMDVFTRGSAPWGTTISSCDKSFGRTPDGTGPWKLTDATPGTANGESKGDIPQS